MKKLIGTAAILMLASNANATISRLKALGMSETDNEGSYYIQDDRNIFLNVANIHNYKDMLIFEWGANGSNAGSSSLTLDTDTATKAKGGIIRSHGDYVYGVYLGNESNTSSLLRTVATGAHAAQATLANSSQGLNADSMLRGSDNQLDLFFGGTAGSLKWGTNFVYTSDFDKSTSARDYGTAVRFGVIGSKWDAFANISTGSKSKRTTTHNFVGLGATFNGTVYSEFSGKLGFHLGGGYQLTDTGKIYAFLKKFDWEQTDTGGTTAGFGSASLNGRGQFGTVDAGFTTYALGYGNVMKSGRGTFYSNVEYRMKEINVDYTTKAEGKNVTLPVTLGYEYEATNWLTLRGSVKQTVWGYKNNNNYGKLNVIAKNLADQEFGTDTSGKKHTFDQTTNVNAGATLNFNNIKIDGFIGTAGTNGTATSTDAGTLSLDRLMTRVGMTYNF